MKKLLITILTIACVEFNLQFIMFEHQPNKATAYDEQGQSIITTDTWEKKGDTYYWNIFDHNGRLINFLNFWTR